METYSILYEDEEILVANKLAPIPVQPEKSGDLSLQELIKRELAARQAPKAEPAAGQGVEAEPKAVAPEATPFLEAAHRIDRRASGAVVFAKTSKALSTLEAAFRDKRVAKEYLACVEREPEPPEGRLEHRLVWDKRRNVVRAAAIAEEKAQGAPATAVESAPPPPGAGPRKKRRSAAEPPNKAVLEYRLAGRSERYFFVEARLVTGRHHQIRAQFSAAGFPIRGDLKYGARRSAPNGLIMLHARRIVLPQPRTGETIEILAPFPASEPLWAAFATSAD